jgi:hypothetical protein
VCHDKKGILEVIRRKIVIIYEGQALTIFLKGKTMKNKSLIMCLGIATLFGGCATTPKESATLSSELGGMIRTARESHLSLVSEYMLQRRARVDDFLQREWIPKYMAKLTKESKFTELYDSEKGSSEKAKIMEEFQAQASKDISEERTEMVNALDQVERMLFKHIVDHYDQMLVINQALTVHLLSAAKVTTAREEIQKKLNLPIEKLVPFEKFDAIFKKIENYEGKAGEINQLVSEAKAIIVQEVKK